MKCCHAYQTTIGGREYRCHLREGHGGEHGDGYGLRHDEERPPRAALDDLLPPLPGLSPAEVSATLVKFWVELALATAPRERLAAATYWDMVSHYANKAAVALRDE